ncbi:hypothetical protein CHY_0462 [Carboxydothermus hydrogenoformans Z-2901]|uniref:Uncharacterized protein n=1 Tax=Carboxydothermus hydrogenoformans (strain ATCC BAA-161 / DSM 6008 / Z-2901) TaxID=246194 RepID=Q3AEW4_CARHZ|nr:hypothetical protein CHY_0462 [Carboxydothermus hydrogenoformans Z-2901]
MTEVSDRWSSSTELGLQAYSLEKKGYKPYSRGLIALKFEG